MTARHRSIVDLHLILRDDGRIPLMRRANTGYGDGQLHRRRDTIVRPTSVYGPSDLNGRVVTRHEADIRPSRGTLDISQARDDLGYQPHIDLETGLQLYDQFLDDQTGAAATAATGRL